MSSAAWSSEAGKPRSCSWVAVSEAEAEESSRAHARYCSRAREQLERNEENRPCSWVASSEADAGESRARDRWVALSAVAVVVGVGDRRAGLIAPGAADLHIDMETPPCPSYLLLPERIAPDPRSTGFTSVVAVAPNRLLVRATQGEGLQRAAYFLADVSARTLAQLPEAPSLFRADASRCIGLIANPLRVDHYLVAQLHPVATGRHESLVTYCTATRRWEVKVLDSAPDHGQWRADGVIAHSDKLWWVDVTRGLLFLDPFLNHPELRFVPLPDWCEMPALDDGMRRSALVDQRRMLRVSEGKLRFVEVAAFASEEPPAVRVWTLVDPEGPNYWSLDSMSCFADIWEHHDYAAAGLPHGVVPPLAVMDPENSGTLSFFFGNSVAAIDVRTNGVVSACDNFWVDRTERFSSFQRSAFVHAWVPGLAVRDDSPPYKESRGNLIKFIGRNPLSHLNKQPQGNVESAATAMSKSESEQPVASPEAKHEIGLANVREKLNAERRPSMMQKLLRERKYLCQELDAAKKEQ